MANHPKIQVLIVDDIPETRETLHKTLFLERADLGWEDKASQNAFGWNESCSPGRG